MITCCAQAVLDLDEELDNIKYQKMKGYRCSECGTGYSTTGNTPPPSPNWDDGHVCTMVEVPHKLNEEDAGRD